MASQEIQHKADRDSQAPKDGLTKANVRIYGDAIEGFHRLVLQSGISILTLL